MYLFTTTETCNHHSVQEAHSRAERRGLEAKGDYYEAYKGSEASIIAQAKRDLSWTPDSPGRVEPYRVRVARRVLDHFGIGREEVIE